MKKIKIFVSNRIDLKSEPVDNPLFVPVRCGAVYDKRIFPKMKGDNTGDNISEMRMAMGECTIQYWAWKNAKADYYGLCHYRRFLNFSNETFPTSEGFIFEKDKISKTADKYGLTDYKKMRKIIEENDVLIATKIPTTEILRVFPPATNMYELWVNHAPKLATKSTIDTLLDIVKEKFPQYGNAAEGYFNQNLHLGYNLFVIKKDLFFPMCEFEFGVIDELRKRISSKELEIYNERTLGFLMEVLYSIFVFYLETETDVKIKELQPIMYLDAEPEKVSIKDKIKRVANNLLPAYRVANRIEERQLELMSEISGLKNQLKTLSQISQKMEMLLWLQEPVYPDNIDDVKKRFWSSFPKASGDLEIIQQGNSILLFRLKDICDELGIKFWLHGGTLIGALRHGGAVPWDDDIDVCIMRPDFEKLKKHLSESGTCYTIKQFYYHGFSCRSYRFTRNDVDSNCFVDVFVYDYFNFNGIEYKELSKRTNIMKKALIRNFRNIMQNHNCIGENLTLDESPELKRELDILLESTTPDYSIIKINECDGVSWGLENAFNVATFKYSRIFKISEIFPLAECTYFGRKFYIPKNYREYIKISDGFDYLDMPKNMGIAGHYNEYFANDEEIDKVKQLLELESFNKES